MAKFCPLQGRECRVDCVRFVGHNNECIDVLRVKILERILIALEKA